MSVIPHVYAVTQGAATAGVSEMICSEKLHKRLCTKINPFKFKVF